MSLFDEWCECEANQNGRKRLLKYTERQNGRAAIAGRLPNLVRSHYDDMQRVAEDIAALGFEPPRVRRRPFGLSYAAMAGWSSMA